MLKVVYIESGEWLEDGYPNQDGWYYGMTELDNDDDEEIVGDTVGPFATKAEATTAMENEK